MNKDFLTKFNFITNILIISALLFGGFVWADSNGIWLRAEDIRGGVFGADELNRDFSFIGEVVFNEDIYANSLIRKGSYYLDLDSESKLNEVEVSLIKSDSSGDIIIQLG